MSLRTRYFFTLTILTASCVSAAVPLPFSVADDKTYFGPTETLRAGDRLQVSSQHLDFNDIIAIARCNDPNCSDFTTIRAWSTHRGKLLESVNILEDGRYIFFGSMVPWALRAENRRGCFRSVPLNRVCSDAKRMAITDSRAGDDFFRVRFSSDTWFWVRKINGAN